MQSPEDAPGNTEAIALPYEPWEAATGGILLLLITLLIVSIELPNQAKTRPSACLNWSSLIYSCISLLGFGATTLLAASLVGSKIPGWPIFWHVFFGVFGFQILLKQTNITVFDKGVLTIQDWIQKALDNAVAESLKKEVSQKNLATIETANKLRLLPEKDLNLYVEQFLGTGSVEQLGEGARKSSADSRHYKAFALAKQKPQNAAAIVKNRSGEPGQ